MRSLVIEAHEVNCSVELIVSVTCFALIPSKQLSSSIFEYFFQYHSHLRCIYLRISFCHISPAPLGPTKTILLEGWMPKEISLKR